MKTNNLITAIRLSLAAARDAQGDTSTPTKTVKVRFLEGFNSRETLDFNLHSTPAEYRLMAYLLGASPTAKELGQTLLFGDGWQTEAVPYVRNGIIIEFRDDSARLDPDEPSVLMPLQTLRCYAAAEVSGYDYFADERNFPAGIGNVDFIVTIPASRWQIRSVNLDERNFPADIGNVNFTVTSPASRWQVRTVNPRRRYG